MEQRTAKIAAPSCVSEQRYATLVKLSPVGMFQTDAAGHCLYVNERWCQIAGLRLEEAAGAGWINAIHPDDRGFVSTEWYAAAQTNRPFRLGYRFQNAAGQITWVMGQAVAEHGVTGEIVSYVGTITDISEQQAVLSARQAAEQGLKIQRDFNQLIAEITSRFVDLSPSELDAEIGRTLQLIGEITQVDTSYVFVFDEEHDTVRMTHEWCKPGYPRQIALAQAIPQPACPWSHALLKQREIIYVPCVADLPPESAIDQATWQQFNLTASLMLPLIQKSVVTGLIGFASSSHAMTWEEETIRLLRVMAQTIANAQQRTHAEQQLYENEERLRLALTAANQGLYDINLQTGKAIVSPQYATMLGYDSDTFEENNAKWIERLHPDDREPVAQTYRDYVSGLLPEYKVEFRQRTQTGEWKWVLSIGKIVAWDEDGNPLRMLGTHTDISDRKQLEITLNQLNQELQVSERKFRAIFNNIFQFVGLLTLDGMLLEANQTALDFGGLKLEDLLNRPFWECRWWTISAATQTQLQQAIARAAQGEFLRYEVDVLGAGDRVATLDFSLRPLRDESGTVVLLIPEGRDITEVKRNEVVRKQAEKLRLELTLLETILNNILAGYWDWNLQNNQEYLSPGFKRMFGYDDHELPNSPESWQHLIFADDLPGVLDCFDRHIQSHGEVPFYNEVRYRHKDGSTVWVICSGRVIEWDAANKPLRLIGCHIDITQRKQAEEQLQKSDTHLKTAQRISKLGSWEFVLKTGQVTWSEETFRIFDRNPAAEPPSFEQLQQLLHPEDRDHHRQVVQTGIDTAASYDVECRFYRSDGTLGHMQARGEPLINAAGQVIQLVGTVLDITDRKQAEEELRNLSDRLTLALKSGAIATWDWHIPDNTLIWDERMFELFGITPDQFTNSYDDWANRLHPDDRASAIAANHLALQGKKDYDHEFRVVHPDGTIRFIKAYALVQYSEQGEPQSMIGINFDITERKQAELKLLQTTAQLEASNRELEAFAYSVSHDLRSPLRAIDGFSKALLEDYGDQFDAEGQDYFNRIRHNVKRMGMLIDDLLRLSRVSRSEMQYSAVNLSALVQEQVHELHTSDPDRQVTVMVAPAVTVLADLTLMRIVVSNLLQNAWKFTSQRPHAAIEFGVMQLDGQPTYFVRDDGAGFDMAYANLLFGVFQRLHNTTEFPGTGIGLATIQRVIHRHGGQVWAQGAVGQGATIYFTVPNASIKPGT